MKSREAKKHKMSVRHNNKIAFACARAKAGRNRKLALELMRYLPEQALEELTADTLGQIIDAMNNLVADVRDNKTVNI